MSTRFVVAVASVGALAASIVPTVASADRGPVYEIDEAQVAAVIEGVEDATGQEVLSGEIAGAAWIAQVPDNWNGDLVIYAHGYRGEGTALTVDPPPAFQFLTANGFAWAASSYRRNSYDPGIGVIDTKNLTKHIQAMLRPRGLDKTYLTGFSMGGHVTAAAIEKYPNIWDGAMPACGVMGDVELFDYFVDYNVGAAALAGLPPTFEWPDPAWTTTTVPSIKTALSTTPDGQWAGGFPQILGVPSPLTPAGESFKDFVEAGSGGDRVMFDEAWYFWHGLANPTGNFFFDLGEGDGTIANRSGAVGQNTDTVYATEYGVDIDDDVLRVAAANRVRNSNGTKPAPLVDGTPPVPVLSIHTIGDLFVPIEMQQIYAREVAANGLEDHLVQRVIRDIGHCDFTGEEIVRSYLDLFEWVENGTRPAGDDLVDDLDNPTVGCEFTSLPDGTDPFDFRPLLALRYPCPPS